MENREVLQTGKRRRVAEEAARAMMTEKLPEQQGVPRTPCFLKEALPRVREEEIGHISNRYMGRTMASNSSRPDIFPGETQEMEADQLDRHPSQCGERVENRRVGEIRIPHRDKPDDNMCSADLLGH